ncbi:MAG: UDP-N-acetylglucosamine 2-epimerase [Phycisphaerales bacterium JB038]
MDEPAHNPRRIAVVTGTRAEFGLLRPVMDAIAARPELELLVLAAGAHLLPPAETIREVEAAYKIAARIPMQRAGETGRLADAAALGRGVQGFAEAFTRLQPQVVLVLGDRIEAFAGASAASVGGIVVAHLHGGDRAEGVADEAMRHAISKLAHLHFPATAQSAERLQRLGENAEHIFQVGSPALDGLAEMPALDEAALAALGLSGAGAQPLAVLLHHPAGLPAEVERDTAAHLAGVLLTTIGREQLLALEPNHDPGREAVLAGLREAGLTKLHPGLPREEFIGLLKRVAASGGVLAGNSSAGLIEASAVGCVSLTVGPRQGGRERGETVITACETETPTEAALGAALARSLAHAKETVSGTVSRYGEGRAGRLVAARLEATPLTPALLRKRNTY